MSEERSKLEQVAEALEGASSAVLLQQRDRLVRLERLLDSGLVLLDGEGSMRLANERACELLGSPRRPWSEICGDLSSVIEAMETRRGAQEMELCVDGRTLNATVTRCNGGSRLVELRDSKALAGVRSDLMMAARVRNLTRLLVGLTHDLKAPLNAITLHLELLRRSLERENVDVDAGAPEHGSMSPTERTRIVESELQRLRRSLDLLLAQAIPSREKPLTFDLREVVAELANLLEAPARHDQKEVEVYLPEHEVPVQGARDHIKQAILNVAINALEAAPTDGMLRLALQCVGDRAVLEVTDDGPGVDASIRERLFDIYVSAKDSGVGAGLFIARSILEAEGGSCELRSTSEHGTTFALELPWLGC